MPDTAVTTLPSYLTKYFWGDDLSQLSWEKNRQYIIQTLLDKGDGASLPPNSKLV